jgi:antitoxin (DNA-binding transcriptional repressor) of toxin-antitoxin stability system
MQADMPDAKSRLSELVAAAERGVRRSSSR